MAHIEICNSCRNAEAEQKDKQGWIIIFFRGPKISVELERLTMRDLLARTLARRFYHRPVFLVGAGRSGTIALFRALGTHPEILFIPGGEIPFVTTIGSAVLPFEIGEKKDYYLEQTKVPKDYLYSQLRRLCFESATGPHYGLKVLLKDLLRSRIQFTKARYWCVKTFPGNKVFEGLLHLYPEAKFIYIVRNGLDVVRSRTKFSAFRDEDFAEHCGVWANAAERFSYLQSNSNAVMVRQEALISQPEVVFEKIYDLLGITHDEKPIEYIRTTLVHSLADDETHDNVDVRTHLENRKPAYEEWSPEQRQTFKTICGAAMHKLEYEIPF